MKFAVMILLSFVVLVGCQTAQPAPTLDISATIAAAIEAALPTAVPTPTPDIEATVEARLQAALPTAVAYLAVMRGARQHRI